MKLSKKILALVLALIIALSAISVSVCAADVDKESTEVTNWVDIPDPTYPSAPEEETSKILSDEQETILSQIGDEVNVVVDNSSGLLSFFDNFMQQIRDFFEALVDVLDQFTLDGSWIQKIGDLFKRDNA